jgi:hypothetical protein
VHAADMLCTVFVCGWQWKKTYTGLCLRCPANAQSECMVAMWHSNIHAADRMFEAYSIVVTMASACACLHTCGR